MIYLKSFGGNELVFDLDLRLIYLYMYGYRFDLFLVFSLPGFDFLFSILPSNFVLLRVGFKYFICI